jgi:hypothetical protein
MILRMSREERRAGMRRRPGHDTPFTIRPSWPRQVNSANGGFLKHVSKIHKPRLEGPWGHILVHGGRISPVLSPNCDSAMYRRLAGVHEPIARCCRGRVPWPNSTDHRSSRTEPLKLVPTLARNRRLLTIREPPFIDSSPRKHRGTIVTASRVATQPRPPRLSRKFRCPSDSARSPPEHFP